MKRLLAICAAVGLIVTACGVIPGTGSGLKVGMVTDIGQLEDKSFNEFSWKGVQDGASAIGAPKPAVIVTKDIADYKQNIQQLVDQKYDIIFTVGFLIGTDTLAAAKANPTIQFFGVDQFVADPAPANYQGLLFAEAQAGYLAGIVAGTITKSGKIGAVGGRSDVPPVVNYIKGYESGAKSVKANVAVSSVYVEDFNAPDKGEAAAKTMIGQGVDVLFQVAGLTGAGVLRAACNLRHWSRCRPVPVAPRLEELHHHQRGEASAERDTRCGQAFQGQGQADGQLHQRCDERRDRRVGDPQPQPGPGGSDRQDQAGHRGHEVRQAQAGPVTRA